ncbi:MAG: vacuolar protein sorting-associated protein Vps13 [Amphiamblys sp. WSBS2006]|nr:MAG: vacuolar protein sorting-associated protein Vps13 [Amphiamblys sp. WSBS2006]
MFKYVLRVVLNKVLGRYIENLTESLELALWKGKVSLKNLKVKKDAFLTMDLPFSVVAGSIEALDIEIPWSALRTRPTQIVLTGATLIVSAKEKTRTAHKTEMAEKKELVDAYEALLQSGDVLEEKGKQEKGLLGRVVEDIIRNIEISIRSVDIRYTSMREVTFGCSVSEIAVETPSTAEGEFEKTVRIEKFFLFTESSENGQEVLLHPESFGVLVHKASGKVTASVVLDQVIADCTKTQYSEILSVLHDELYLSPDHSADVFSRVLATIEESNRKRGWSYIQEKCTQRKKYTEMYTRFLAAGVDREALLELERDLDYSAIVLYRRISRKHRQKKAGWINWLLGSKNEVEQEVDEYIERLGSFEDRKATENTSQLEFFFFVDAVKMQVGELLLLVSNTACTVDRLRQTSFSVEGVSVIAQGKTIAQIGDTGVAAVVISEEGGDQKIEVRKINAKINEEDLSFFLDQKDVDIIDKLLSMNKKTKKQKTISPLQFVCSDITLEYTKRFTMSAKCRTLRVRGGTVSADGLEIAHQHGRVAATVLRETSLSGSFAQGICSLELSSLAISMPKRIAHDVGHLLRLIPAPSQKTDTGFILELIVLNTALSLEHTTLFARRVVLRKTDSSVRITPSGITSRGLTLSPCAADILFSLRENSLKVFFTDGEVVLCENILGDAKVFLDILAQNEKKEEKTFRLSVLPPPIVVQNGTSKITARVSSLLATITDSEMVYAVSLAIDGTERITEKLAVTISVANKIDIAVQIDVLELRLQKENIEDFVFLLLSRFFSSLAIFAEEKEPPSAETHISIKTARILAEDLEIETGAIEGWFFGEGQSSLAVRSTAVAGKKKYIAQDRGPNLIAYTQSSSRRSLALSLFTVDADLLDYIPLLESFVLGAQRAQNSQDTAAGALGYHLSDTVLLIAGRVRTITLSIPEMFLGENKMSLKDVHEKNRIDSFSVSTEHRDGVLFLRSTPLSASLFVDDLVSLYGAYRKIVFKNSVPRKYKIAFSRFPIQLRVLDSPSQNIPFARVDGCFCENNVLCFSVFFFNVVISEWEPLVEPAKCAVSVKRELQGTASLVFLAPLEITLSVRFLQRLRNVRRTYLDTAPLKNRETKITNIVDVSFAVYSRSVLLGTAHSQCTSIFQIPPSVKALQIVSSDGGWSSKEPLHITAEGARTLTVTNAAGDRRRLVVAIEADERTRTISLEPLVVFENKTHTPVDIRVLQEDRTEAELLGILPEERRALPFLLKSYDKIRFRPARTSFWSSSLVGRAELERKGSAGLVCLVNNKKENPFYIVLSTTQAETQARGQTVLSINAPVAVRNGLYDKIEFTLLEQNRERKTVEIETGQATNVHKIDIRYEVYLSLSIPRHGVRTTTAASFLTRTQLPDKDLAVVDAAGYSASILIKEARRGDGTVEFVLYPKYILVNNTGNHIGVRDEKGERIGCGMSAADGSPAVFFSLPKQADQKISLAFEKTTWSPFVDISSIGTALKTELTGLECDYSLGLLVAAGDGVHADTTVVTVSKRHFVINQTGHALRLRWFRNKDQEAILEAPDQAPVPLDTTTDTLASVSFKKERTWSRIVDLTAIGSAFVLIDERLARCKTVLKDEKVFVVVKYAPDGWTPFAVENKILHTAALFQTGNRRIFEAAPNSRCGFFFEEPAGKKRMKLKVSGMQTEKEIDPSRVGLKKKIALPGETVLVSVNVRDGVFVVRLGGQTEASPEEHPAPAPQLSLSLTAAQIGLSFLDRTKKEQLYLFMKDVYLEKAQGEASASYRGEVGWVSVENKEHEPRFPFVAKPSQYTTVGRTGSEFTGLRAELACILSEQTPFIGRVFYNPVLLFYVCVEPREDSFVITSSVALEGLTITLDIGTIEKTMLLFSELQEKTPGTTAAKGLLPDERTFYFRLFEVSSIDLHLTLVGEEDSFSGKRKAFPKISRLLNTVGVIDSLPISFQPVSLVESNIEQYVFVSYIGEIYTQQLRKKLFKAVGFAEVTGDPAGLFRNVYSGVRDFEGGVLYGGQKFVKKTVSGLSGSVEKMTKTISRGLSKITLDRKFQTQRMARMKKEEHQIVFGLKQLSIGVGSALWGLAENPVNGAIEGGVGGCISGVGRGVVGLVTKPTLGLFDVFYGASSDITKAVSVKQPVPERVRLTRLAAHGDTLRCYSLSKAIGQAALALSLPPGPEHVYTSHISIPEEHSFLVASTKSLVLFDRETLRPLWAVQLDDVRQIHPHLNTVVIYLAGNTKRILRATPERLAWLYRAVAANTADDDTAPLR